MSEPNQSDGNGGSSDGDTQPDDTGARPGPAATPERTGERQAEGNREDDPPG
jgi:hypothetical protein